MALVDMKPMITAATASAEATDRLAAAIDRLAAAQERANNLADAALLAEVGRA